MAKDTFLHMRISGDVIRALDALRKDENDLPNRSDMVRRLIARAVAQRRDVGSDSKRAARR